MRVRDLIFCLTWVFFVTTTSAFAEIEPLLDPFFEPLACVKGAPPLPIQWTETSSNRAPASATSTALAEIAYQGKQSPHHRYWITEVRGRTTQYRLHFEDQNRHARVRILTTAQANKILAQATQIVWDAQYLTNRERVARCTPYAILSTAGERSKICVEHRKAATQSYGLFNSIRRYFR